MLNNTIVATIFETGSARVLCYANDTVSTAVAAALVMFFATDISVAHWLSAALKYQ